MKKSCLFCSSLFQSEKEVIFFKDRYFFAVPDLFPKTFGHVLLITKKHYSDFFSLPVKERTKIGGLIFNVGKLLQKTFSCDGINVVINNGTVAGQEIKHFHVHLVPRFSNSKIQKNTKKNAKSEQILCAQKLKKSIKK